MNLKKIFGILVKVIIGLVLLFILEVLCTFIIGRPIISIKKDNMYSGLFFNVYNCNEYTMPQIKAKWSKFSCSTGLIDYGKYRLVGDSKNNCEDEVELYLDGDRKIYLVCIDKVYVKDGNNKKIELKKFINNDVNRFDSLMNNYDGEPFNDGGSITYKIESDDNVLRVDVCHKIGGSNDIYIGYEKMKFMCNN